MWRNELRERDVVYWEESRNKEVELVKMLEIRDKGIPESLVSRDKAWLLLTGIFDTVTKD